MLFKYTYIPLYIHIYCIYTYIHICVLAKSRGISKSRSRHTTIHAVVPLMHAFFELVNIGRRPREERHRRISKSAHVLNGAGAKATTQKQIETNDDL